MKEVIELFYELNYNRMCAVAYNSTKNSWDAEDIVQSTFERMLKYSNTFEGGNLELVKWSNTLLRNCILDWVNSDKLGGMSVELKEDDMVTKETLLEDSLVPAQVGRLIAKMKGEDNRQVCNLYFLMGYLPREICEILPLKIKNISQIIFRFKSDLRKVYG